MDKVFGLAGYTCIGTIRAHAGYVALLFRHDLAPQAERVQVPFMVPAVMAKLTCRINSSTRGIHRTIMVASCHLAPFADSANQRMQQVEDILSSSSPLPLIVAGDTNMRVKEDYVMEQRLDLKDFWKLAGSHAEHRFTWDTQDHRPAGGHFNRYYGDDTRQYHSRYDRIYIHPQGALTPTVTSFDLIANDPIPPSKTHFLSDHFGMEAKVNLQWMDATEDSDGSSDSNRQEKPQKRPKIQST
jgi:endonuclease/exonuclease/phosphatase family metal-dependent hydrolase